MSAAHVQNLDHEAQRFLDNNRHLGEDILVLQKNLFERRKRVLAMDILEDVSIIRNSYKEALSLMVVTEENMNALKE